MGQISWFLVKNGLKTWMFCTENLFLGVGMQPRGPRRWLPGPEAPGCVRDGAAPLTGAAAPRDAAGCPLQIWRRERISPTGTPTACTTPYQRLKLGTEHPDDLIS